MKLFFTDLPKPPYWPPQSDPKVIASALQYVRHRDPYGNVAHQILAMAYCFTLPLSTAGNAVTFALLAGYGLLRSPNTWRCYNPLLLSATLGAVVLFVGWYAMSTTWSVDTAQGLDELAAARVMALPLMLWPVIDKMHWYIGAALAGVAAQNVVQTLQFFELLDYQHGASGRLGGWVQPIQTGAWCAAALCWHCSALLTSRQMWLRLLSGAGVAAAGAGLLASGSRGPWIAAAVAVPAVLLVVFVRAPSARRAALVFAGGGLLALVAGWFAASGFLNDRIGGAVAEYRAAVDEQEYWTSTGSRIAFWSWAIDIWQPSPIIGAGAGSFPKKMRELPQYQQTLERARMSEVYELEGAEWAVSAEQPLDVLPGYEKALATGERRIELYLDHDHAHSTYFHTLAGTGVVGLALLVGMLVLIARRCALDPRTHPYVDGTLGVLIVWIVGAQFECFHLNGHLLGMLALVLTATLPNRAMALEQQ